MAGTLAGRSGDNKEDVTTDSTEIVTDVSVDNRIYGINFCSVN